MENKDDIKVSKDLQEINRVMALDMNNYLMPRTCMMYKIMMIQRSFILIIWTNLKMFRMQRSIGKSHSRENEQNPRNLWSDKQIRCILKKLHLFIKFMDEGKYENTKKTMDCIGYFRIVCHCFFHMDI